MAYKTVRPLAPEFIEHVLPKLPPTHFTASNVTKADTVNFTNKLTEAKQFALAKYWTHLSGEVNTEDIQIKLRDGVETILRIYTPRMNAVHGKMPVIYVMHGGAFISGSIESEDLISRQFCTTAGAVVFSLEYRLAPDHKVIEGMFADAEDGLVWTHEHAAEYGGDISRGIVLDGTSSGQFEHKVLPIGQKIPSLLTLGKTGGAMAAMCGYRGRSLGIKIRGVVLRQPVLITASYEKLVPKDWLPSLKSRHENWDAPLLSGQAMANTQTFLDISDAQALDSRNFPIFASKEELAHYPPTYFCEAECDPLVDESILFAKRLREVGVPVKETLYKGMPHGFHAHHVLATARQEMTDTAEGLRWLLDQRV